MKPITFENLRRLVGGGRKGKKDRAESSFKRSDSFKRISIKRNYLERGGGKAKQAAKAAAAAATASAVGGGAESAAQPEPASLAAETTSKLVTIADEEPDSMVIGYNQWIRGMRDGGASTAEGSGKLRISVEPAPSTAASRRPPTPPPRLTKDSGSVEILRFERSPVYSRRQPRCFRGDDLGPSASASVGSSRPDSALSVSLGRVWMDAPLAMAPRSLELPRPSPTSSSGGALDGGAGKRAHHSLDSALKDHHRFQPRTISPAVSSSKDSGFSFSNPRLSDAPLPSPPPFSPPSSGGGFFRKKKPAVAKPKPSVSRDGYFKRTSGASCSVRRNSSRKRKGGGGGQRRKGQQSNTARSDMYQVVISRPPRSLAALKLDPMIFVPPERRSARRNNHKPVKYEVREIRDYCAPHDSTHYPLTLGGLDDDDDDDDGLYESILGDYHGKQCDSAERQYPPLPPTRAATDGDSNARLGDEPAQMPSPAPGPVRSSSSGDKTSRSLGEGDKSRPILRHSKSHDVGEISARPIKKGERSRSVVSLLSTEQLERQPANYLPELPVAATCITLTGDAASESDDEPPTPPVRVTSVKQIQCVTVVENSESEETSEEETYVPLGVSPVPRRRPVRRKKSQQLRGRNANVKYLAKPGVHRAASTLRRSRRGHATKKTGDITQKGYEKKRTRLLAPYVPKQSQAAPGGGPSAAGGGGGGCGSGSSSPGARARRRGNRRLTRNESRYHSEVRQEAVQQALAAMQGRPKPSLPMPSKRTSVMAKSPDRDRDRHDSASSSDEDSVVNEGGGDVQSTPERERAVVPRSHQHGHQHPQGQPQLQSDTSSTGSARETPPQQRERSQQPRHTRLPNGGPGLTVWDERDVADITDVMHNMRPYSQPPDVTHNTAQSRRLTAADRVNRYNQSRQSSTSDDNMGTGRWKVSAKIQQLLNTLKRPKRRPLPEFYEDDDIELEIAANPKDPNAPKPEGSSMTSAIGEQLVVPSGLPRNLEAAIQRYGSASYKAPVATVLDPNGKLTITLTYGKLLSRSQKIAYTLLNKAFSKGGDTCLKPGDRIALVYPNNDPINFICAFYGCLQAGIVPVPIEVPLTRRDAGSQQIGFLLGSCGIQVALTSEACLKGLPKTATGEVVAFKGWPKLQWFVTEHLAKTPKDWLPPPRLTDDTPAYIEYTTDKDGSVMGVTVTRTAMLAHCRTLTMACSYTEGENMVCVLDFKREVGLWHSVLTSVLNGMHVIFIPYALMKVNPASWMQMITKYRASVAVVKSRDLHWGLLATKDHKEVSLSSLRLLLVADGANPWSLSSCDQFLGVFQAKGLRPDAICPCASSSECLTVSVRRPGRAGVNATGRGVLSMSGLSYGVVRVDQENSLTSLTLQDCGQVMPGSVIVVVKMDGPSYLCKTDEVGEICVNSSATGSQYWGLQGLTNSTFRVQPLHSDSKPIGEAEYVRSGLLGFLGPGGLVFVCGSRDGLMTVTGRKHNADDIIATVLAVEPMKFIYRGRIAVFSIRVLRDERICVIAEQRPDCSEEESFQWMSRVLQAVDSIHQVGIYCLALVPPNYLPKTPLGGIHLSETKRRFLEGTLHPANVLLCPHTCVTNLPKPREIHSDVGPASVMVGNIVQGNRLASAQGRDMGIVDEESDSARKYQFISEILKWRAQSTADHVIFTLLNSKGTVAVTLSCSQLHKKAERVGNLLLEKGKINTGDHVALIFPPGIDLICAFYGCLYVGAVPVTIRPPHPQNLQTTLPTVRMIVDVSKSVLVLSNQNVIKLLKSKEASNVVDIKSWPITLDTDDMPKKKLPTMYRAPTAEMLAYLDFSVSTTGMLAGIKMSHAAVTSLCRSMKLACELYPSRHIALCLDPYCGLGFALWCLSSIYSGHHSILIPPSEVEVNPALWLSAVSQYRVRDTFCSYGVMELCTKGLGTSVNQLKQRGINLGCVRTCVVVAEERPRISLTTSFSKLFSALGLSPRAVSTSFGCRVNVAICLQGASSPEPSTVYVDLRALRNDRVSLVERGSPHSLCLMESGKLLPGVKVIIANPETKGQCGDSHLGEIWVQSSHNASGYFTIYGDESDYADHFNARLVTGTTGETYARTGYLGFLRRTECTGQQQTSTVIGSSIGEQTSAVLGAGGEGCDSPAPTQPLLDAPELHDAVFVVGALDETIMLRGMRYHPIDIENSVMRCHKKIAECAVFTWTNLLVVVVELDGNENEALDLVPLVTNTVLEEHHLVVGVVVVVDPGVVPINSRGEKQRMHLRDGFLADQLDPIYVAYNM
ncbi:disco-interacting protein 2 isoform X2 [Schistocerca serialis cubense]|uniref:disco-interacting protein 2 isoform X2 n=1 Tax=Schistocerca serialis cubense TaxID=2023355 RepID=UPI00214DF8B1|nr:disco-interacting protein 2 isoform X2 [Schistocerca serialis cubense]